MQKIDKVRLFEGITYIDPAFVEEASAPLKKTPANIIWLKKLGSMAAALVFAAALLFSVNAAFPAFAESLPLIGEVFRHLNSLGSNASSYDGMIQSIEESGENDQYKVIVTEAYCDGEYLFFALRLQAKDTKLLKMETLYTEESIDDHDAPGWSIALNGESGGLVYDLPVFTRKGSYFESSPIKTKLPDDIDQSIPIHVEAAIGNLSGRTQEAIDAGNAGQILSIEPVYLSFDVTANISYNQQKATQGVVIDSLELQSWSCSPSKLSVTLAYPYFDMTGVSVSARTEDGLDLGEDLRESGDFGDGRYAFGDTAVQECTFVGPPDGTKKVIVTVYEKYPWERTTGSSVFGEFTIDLETGEAAVTTAYLDEGFEHSPIDKYADAKIAEEKNSNGVIAPSWSPVPEIF